MKLWHKAKSFFSTNFSATRNPLVFRNVHKNLNTFISTSIWLEWELSINKSDPRLCPMPPIVFQISDDVVCVNTRVELRMQPSNISFDTFQFSLPLWGTPNISPWSYMSVYRFTYENIKFIASTKLNHRYSTDNSHFSPKIHLHVVLSLVCSSQKFTATAIPNPICGISTKKHLQTLLW